MTKFTTIRRAYPSEYEQLSAIAFNAKAYWGYSAEFMEAARVELSVSRADLSSQRYRYRVAEAKKVIRGFYAITPISTDEFRLSSLFVEPQSIGQGVGRLLMDHAKAYVQSKGAKSILIQSDPYAARFYKAAGGTVVGETESGSIPGRFLPEIRIILG